MNPVKAIYCRTVQAVLRAALPVPHQQAVQCPAAPVLR